MATDLVNTFEGGADGVTLTTGNSGGASGDAFTGVANWVFTNVQKRGTMAIRVVNPAAAIFVVRWATVGTPAALRGYVWFTTLPAVDITLLHLGDGASASFTITTAGKARLTVAGTQWTATANFPTNQWVRVELFATASTNSANGTAKIAYYLGDDTSAVEESGLISNLNTAAATGTFNNSRYGKNSTGSYPGDIYLDNLASRYGTGTTDFIGPAVTPPIVGSVDLVWTGGAWE